MRKTDKKTIQTLYNRTYEDKAQEFVEPSLTNENYESLCDVNYLLQTFNGAPRTPVYGEQSSMTFEDWQNERARIRERFNDLTPELKARFGNAAEFFKYCIDPKNYVKDTVDVGTQTDFTQEEVKDKVIEKKDVAV